MPKRYKYNMNHHWIGESQIGQLNPVMIQEVTPGDVWYGNVMSVYRLGPLNLPTFMQLNVYQYAFFVPHSQVFPEFPDVITGKDTVTAWPTKLWSEATVDKWRIFGLGAMGSTLPDQEINLLPIMAYNHVYNSHFRHKENFAEVALDNVDEQRISFPPNSYFMSAQNELQQGAAETIDTSGATVDATAVRDAMARQRQKERRRLFGEDYRDLLLADYGVKIPDTVIQEPYLVGRGKATMGVSEVVATASSTGETTGEYKGHGIVGLRFSVRPRMFREHGTFIIVTTSRPRYQNRWSFHRIFHPKTKDDLYHPHLADNSMDTIKATEVFSNHSDGTADFAYQAKYEWLRGAQDVIAGDMQVSPHLNWTAHADWLSLPTLAYLQQVRPQINIFQEPGVTGLQLAHFNVNNFKKLSFIKRRPKR